jgi:hypothetical protein
MTLWPVDMRWNARGQGGKNKKITRRRQCSTLPTGRLEMIRRRRGNFREMRLVPAPTARRSREFSMPPERARVEGGGSASRAYAGELSGNDRPD